MWLHTTLAGSGLTGRACTETLREAEEAEGNAGGVRLEGKVGRVGIMLVLNVKD